MSKQTMAKQSEPQYKKPLRQSKLNAGKRVGRLIHVTDAWTHLGFKSQVESIGDWCLILDSAHRPGMAKDAEAVTSSTAGSRGWVIQAHSCGVFLRSASVF